MNQNPHTKITILMLGMMTLMSSICLARDRSRDSMVVERIWEYQQRYGQSVQGVSRNVYMVYQFGTRRRNPLLFLVPTMYSIAKGRRTYIGETYGRLTYRSQGDFDMRRQVMCGTIPHNRNVMPALVQLTTPDIYGTLLYRDRMLSPFNRSNRFFYKYSVTFQGGSSAIVSFRPRCANTQLVKGVAVVDTKTGYILSLSYKGNYDMIDFSVDILMSRQETHITLPLRCVTAATFKFVGNRIHASCASYFNCPTTLPDSIADREDPQLMETLRPVALSNKGEAIYQELKADEADTTTTHRHNRFREVAWDVIGDNMVNRVHASAGAFDFSSSPLLNPLYMGYSNSKGIAYKLNLSVQYNWNSHRYLTFSPQLGYNTKRRQFYYNLPLRMTYNPKRRGYVELKFGNGEQISNDILARAFKEKLGGDTLDMPNFEDTYVQLTNNILAFDWLEFNVGLVYHERKSMQPELMEKAKLESTYRTFAPVFTVHLTPWRDGPTLTANYEHSFKNILKSNLEYERWEFDAVYKYNIGPLRLVNLRAGAGFYTRRSSEYFVDYANFHDENLPTGWDDDWTGQFQLVPVAWYNQSRYYLRGNASYDSPLLALSWVPWVGKVIESERVYISSMTIEHIGPYSEIGYGFRNRFFSTAVFASFLKAKVQRVGFKFTIEIFRRW